jgi:hypothetical protein
LDVTGGLKSAFDGGVDAKKKNRALRARGAPIREEDGRFFRV